MYNLLKAMHILYFYPRPPRGGRRLRDQQARHAEGISIHALREEGDHGFFDELQRSPKISIHALREEGDLPFDIHFTNLVVFLSTPSARRATL